MNLSTHVLDLESGQPAKNIRVTISRDGAEISSQETDADGRCGNLLEGAALEPGTYQLVFDVASYFAERSGDTFYDNIPVAFIITDTTRHYHVPLLLSPFGYSTYRGS